MLDSILKEAKHINQYPNLLVGHHTKDDAAAYDIGDGRSILSTTDFFMPIVDDPFTFGRIAATNAISDVYAMGGKPLMAVAILGWPIKTLPAEIAAKVLEGGRAVCEAAGIPLAGGHSIDSPEPIFGLAVTGVVDNERLRMNNNGEVNCELFLTKPLGIGILTTAQKQKKIEGDDLQPAIDAMCTLNKFGETVSRLDGVVTMTDITGFGLLGHLGEICEASGISAELDYDKIPFLPNTHKYLAMGCIPGGTKNNYKSYGHTLGEMTDDQKWLLCDAQTSGGLLAVVRKDTVDAFLALAAENGLELQSIGRTKTLGDKLITLRQAD